MPKTRKRVTRARRSYGRKRSTKRRRNSIKIMTMSFKRVIDITSKIGNPWFHQTFCVVGTKNFTEPDSCFTIHDMRQNDLLTD